jgi:hypothetical protein
MIWELTNQNLASNIDNPVDLISEMKEKWQNMKKGIKLMALSPLLQNRVSNL